MFDNMLYIMNITTMYFVIFMYPFAKSKITPNFPNNSSDDILVMQCVT